jgi:hypothetical protein
LDDIHGLNYICMIHWISLSWISINNSKSIDIPWLIMLMVDHWTKDQGVTSTLVIVDHHIATTSTNVGYQNWSARHWKKRHLKLSIGPWPKYAKIPQQYGMTKTLTVKKAGS